MADKYPMLSFAEYKISHMNGLRSIPCSPECFSMQSDEMWIVDGYRAEMAYRSFMRSMISEHTRNPVQVCIDLAREVYELREEVKALKSRD